MSKTKEHYFDKINQRNDLVQKYIDDEYFYNQYMISLETLKNRPLSSCCKEPVSFIEMKNNHFIICKKCFNFCKIV